MRPIYLDYNATTPIAPRVQEAMLPFLAEQFGNPISDHVLGRAAALAIEDARHRVAKSIGAYADEVFFTSGASESCRFAIRGEARREAGDSVIGSSIEHHAVRNLLESGGGFGCGPNGVATVEHLADSRPSNAAIICLAHANNEIGSIQPVKEFSKFLEGQGAWLYSDATQSFGKIPVNVNDLGVDMLTLASHKAYGPKGAGALYLRRGMPVGKVFNNGCTLSEGTVDVAAIVGFGYAAELASESLHESAPKVESLRNHLLGQLREGVGECLVVWGESAERLPNTLAVAFPGVAGDELLAACPEVCASPLGFGAGGGVTLSSTLKAIGADPEIARGTVRLSVGWYTTEEEIDRAASLLLGAWERLCPW